MKVELNQEVDLESDSDSEVQREPDSEVESYEVDFEEGNRTYEDVDQPEVEADSNILCLGRKIFQNRELMH